MSNIVSAGKSAGNLPAGTPPRGVPRDWTKPWLPPQAEQPPAYVFRQAAAEHSRAICIK